MHTKLWLGLLGRDQLEDIDVEGRN